MSDKQEKLSIESYSIPESKGRKEAQARRGEATNYTFGAKED